MDDYLGKPFTLEQLQAALARRLPPVAPGDSGAGPGPNEPSGIEVDLEAPEQAPATPLPARLDPRGLDQIRALQRPGAPSIVGKVIRIYLTSTPELLTAMRAGMVQRNSEAVRQAAHSLKSASANLGATGLAELCRALESQARGGGCPEPGVELEALETEFQQVHLELQAELSRSA
jgi:HPt (histidine-containing phosphotransfer) domain-containing protein